MDADEIELLSPAKNLESGISAVNCGADAVYIGADSYSARKKAGNSIFEIEKLVKYSHKYYSRVYVALNTIFYDEDIENVRKKIYEIYNCGADAIIFQDVSILEMDLPPISLHASTQFNNYDFNRIKFIDNTGVDRIILARELGLEDIRKISPEINAEVEVFIHGALCVSISGQCYLSHAIGNRSANRGECAQPCRKKWSLIDSAGEIISENKYLLSIKDLSRSDYLAEMINAGVKSFKIEGRMKDPAYIKNITAYYRKKLDEIIVAEKYKKSSSGNMCYSFNPDIYKTFNRSYTDFSFFNKDNSLGSNDSPKSTGEYLGRVSMSENSFFVIDMDDGICLNPGDGICYYLNGELTGSSVNRFDGNKIFVNSKFLPKIGNKIYRNYDINFHSKVENDDCCERKILCDITLNNDFIEAIDEDKNKVRIEIGEYDRARNSEKNIAIILKSLKKTGNTCFKVRDCVIDNDFDLFIKISHINSMRRELLEKLLQERMKNFEKIIPRERSVVNYYEKDFNYNMNVSNYLAENFYKKRGVENTSKAFELQKVSRPVLMKSKYCILNQLKLCRNMKKFKEPFFIKDDEGDCFELELDCTNCVMKIVDTGAAYAKTSRT